MKEKKPIKLTDIPRKDVFNVPEGYFEGLQDRISERIARPQGKQVFLERPLVRRLSLAVAAAVALLIVAIPFLNNRNELTAEQLISQLSPEDCLYYLEHSDIETADILALIETEDLFDEQEQLLPPAEMSDDELDLLFERYGVTEDEKLQTL